MPANPNWARWIFASVHTALLQVNSGVPFLMEGVDERTDAFLEAPSKVEARANGPYVKPQQGCSLLWVDINVLVTNHMDGDTKSRHELHRLAGLYQEALTAPIEVWNYGNEAGDWDENVPASQIFLGCLVNRHGNGDMTKLFNFGQVEKTDRVKQAIVDARYEITLEG
jgi:hypothetical protein